MLKNLGLQDTYKELWLGSLPLADIRHNVHVIDVQPSIYNLATALELNLPSFSRDT